ncbi:hypothetical protein [Primorskyibacter sp. S87]|uniref:hypothetical protein n=1 Tax=Primorskyibacter sp. S87 TaxID=3415126 RepID=UPI003C7A692C
MGWLYTAAYAGELNCISVGLLPEKRPTRTRGSVVVCYFPQAVDVRKQSPEGVENAGRKGSGLLLNTLNKWFLSLVVLVAVASAPARADLTPMTGAAVARNIAQISVSNEGVTIAIEIFVEDLRYFAPLLPDTWVPEGAAPRPPEAARLKAFSERGLKIVTGQGKVLPVSVRLIEPRNRVDRAPPNAGMIDPITGRMFPKPPDDPRVVYAELFYDFKGPRPHELKFTPPLNEEGEPFLSIGMIVFDREVPVTDFRYLSGGANLTIDWDDPWYTKFDNPNLRRHHRYPVMTFIYAEPYEIRYEAVLRVREAAELAGVELGGEFFSEGQRDAIAGVLPDLVNNRSPMTIEGQPVRPDFDRMSYLRIGASGLVFLEEGEEIRTDAALVGLIYSVPTEKFVKEATVEWTLFSEGVDRIPSQVIDAAGPYLMDLTSDDPVMVWTNHFKKPPYPEVEAVQVDTGPDRSILIAALAVITAILAGFFLISLVRPGRVSRRLGVTAAIAAVVVGALIPGLYMMQHRAALQMSDEQLQALTTEMLGNIYRAFDFRLEDHVYDRLALTLTGDVLERVYLEQRASLRVERAGGAQARVDALEVSRVENLQDAETGTLHLSVDWGVSGIVGHWGHNHRRTNTYTAEMVIQPEDGAWKISGFEVLSQERI